VEEGKLRVDFGSNAQASSSSPQKSPGLKVIDMKKPVRPPFGVELSSFSLIIKSISVTGSPSPTIYSFLEHSNRTLSAPIWDQVAYHPSARKKGTCK
jgi:hypothetical protein